MVRSLLRLFYSAAIGVSLTFLAGYVGSLAFPAAIELWCWSLLISLFVNIKATAALLVTPSLYGAQFAWPVTCVLFPLIGLVRQPATVIGVRPWRLRCSAWSADYLHPVCQSFDLLRRRTQPT
jgi:hypothetical protein